MVEVGAKTSRLRGPMSMVRASSETASRCPLSPVIMALPLRAFGYESGLGAFLDVAEGDGDGVGGVQGVGVKESRSSWSRTISRTCSLSLPPWPVTASFTWRGL